MSLPLERSVGGRGTMAMSATKAGMVMGKIPNL